MPEVTYKVGDHVRVVTPENRRLDGTKATVAEPAEWGAHLDAPAAATGKFRAHHSEMRPDVAPRSAGYSPSGEFCKDCGGANLVRTGACLTCADCGSNSGCG